MQSVIGEHSRSLDPVVGGLDSHWFGLHSLEVRQTELEVELGATRRNSPSAQPECGMHCVNEWLGSGRQVPEGQSSQTFSSSANILPGPHSFGVVVVHVNVAVVTVVVAMLVVVLVTVVVVLVTDVVEVEDVRVAVVEVTVVVVLVTVVMVLVTDVAVAVVIVTVMGAVVAESSSTVQRAACWKIAITECHIKEVL